MGVAVMVANEKAPACFGDNRLRRWILAGCLRFKQRFLSCVRSLEITARKKSFLVLPAVNRVKRYALESAIESKRAKLGTVRAIDSSGDPLLICDRSCPSSSRPAAEKCSRDFGGNSNFSNWLLSRLVSRRDSPLSIQHWHQFFETTCLR